jgi:hypothetical protein
MSGKSRVGQRNRKRPGLERWTKVTLVPGNRRDARPPPSPRSRSCRRQCRASRRLDVELCRGRLAGRSRWCGG